MVYNRFERSTFSGLRLCRRYLTQHFQKGRKEKLLFGIFRKLIDPDRFEVLDARPAGVLAPGTGDHREVLAGFARQFHLTLQGDCHSIYVVVGVGKMSDLERCLGMTQPALVFGEMLPDPATEAPILSEQREGHKIRGQHGIEGTG